MIHINVYADEIQEVKNFFTGKKWLYMGAIYEIVDRPIVEKLLFYRYMKNMKNWKKFFNKNNLEIHWSRLKNNIDKKNILNRWLDFILEDCIYKERRFRFSILGINISNLCLEEFGEEQSFNNIYNRFFRSMLASSIKKFFSEEVIVDHIYHEEGQQEKHKYFDWHTILKLKTKKNLVFSCDRVEFLPKSHLADEKSNTIQLCDSLLGIFKDLHLGYDNQSYPQNKKDIIFSQFVQDFFIKRLIRNPNNKKSSYGYSNRFSISLFPKIKTPKESIERLMTNHYYDISKIELSYESSSSVQERLF